MESLLPAGANSLGLARALRVIQLKQWKQNRTIFRELRAKGASFEVTLKVAGNSRRWWRNSAKLINAVLTIKWADQLGMPRLT